MLNMIGLLSEENNFQLIDGNIVRMQLNGTHS